MNGDKMFDRNLPETDLVLPIQFQDSAKKVKENRNRRIIIGIILSAFVLIACIAWVSTRLVSSKNLADPPEGIEDDDGEDWRSITNDDMYYENEPYLPDVERNDILLDDEFETDFILSNDNHTVGEDMAEARTYEDVAAIVACPPPGDLATIDFPSIISQANVGGYHNVLLNNSFPGILCTLLEVFDDVGDDVMFKPVGRSYNGHGWEPYRGPFTSTIDLIPLLCANDNNNGGCIVSLPSLDSSRKFVLRSYAYSLGKRDKAARFLERATFGATTSEISEFVNDGNDHVNWIRTQMNLPVTSHRQFYRERATAFHPETTQMGTLTFDPCKRGAQYRRFVFLKKDVTEYLTISTSPIDSNYKILSVAGQIRSIIQGQVEQHVPTWDFPVVPDGSYYICGIAHEPGIGKHVSIQIDSRCTLVYFDRILGNPVVQFDAQHLSLIKSLVTIDEKYSVPAMTEFYGNETQMKQLASDVLDGRCSSSNSFGGEHITIASISGEYWIHTPSFRLEDNRLHAPLFDGGKSKVEETANAPNERMRVLCSNAPRTYLNEDHCVLSDNACSLKHDTYATGVAGIVCGSPYESANKHTPQRGVRGSDTFDVSTPFNITHPHTLLEEQKETVWLGVALTSEDQLRQRMAWALSQILVISPNSIKERFHTESFLTYYDIFARNAFGNYFSILKDVTYSPLMAEMLTYNDGVSTGFAWTRWNKLHHADENYAREILQLFSIGLYALNIDGTLQVDANGHEIRTYKNTEISEYARVFVGFRNQPTRGNIEERRMMVYGLNAIDPLQIIPDRKDLFPKLGMNNRYVGDGYPLCKDIPTRSFLKKGSIFRFLGPNPNPDLLNDPDEWWGSNPTRISLNNSTLAAILCNQGDSAECSPPMKVILDSDLECFGIECEVDELRTFELVKGSGLWFEYIRPPCVNHAFYDGAQSIRRRWGHFGHAMCGDPNTLAASTVCCGGFRDIEGSKSQRVELFSGERVSLPEAMNRCSLSTENPTLCKNPLFSDCEVNGGCDNMGTFYWSSSKCFITAKINEQGRVALVHNPQIDGVETDRTVSSDAITFFGVDWLNDDADSLVRSLVDDCARFGCANGEGRTCICSVFTTDTMAFESESDLHSAEAILSSATVGSFMQIDAKFEQITRLNGVSKYPSGDLTSETVFRIVDSQGRTHFRKNTKHEVHLMNGLVFRNPVTFYTLSEPTIRDAAYEVDAALEHAFFHPNMAPFIAVRLAQRFGVSNPSPRYVKAIATSFREGIYKDVSTGRKFGSGDYGCLTATVAALMLDREMLDPILDADPAHGSIREPYLKLVKVLRTLEFKGAKGRPLLTIQADLQSSIGQQTHKHPSVFSFFKSEYQPPGKLSVAGMSSPESQVLSGQTSVRLTYMLLSFLKYGASSCFGGFGMQYSGECRIAATNYNDGESSFQSSNYGLLTSTEVVDELATLLTSGRLDGAKRAIMKDAYEETIANGKSAKEAMINVQQLIVASPEFHTTNLMKAQDGYRAAPILPEPNDDSYKAVVFVMLPGGYDSFNVLVPKSCNTTNIEGKLVHDQYMDQRGSISLDAVLGEFDLTLDTTETSKICNEFAIHDELRIVKDLFDEKSLSFIANAGIINNQGYEIARVDPYDKSTGPGVLGRAKDVLTGKGFSVSALSIDNPSIATEGTHGKSPPSTVVGRRGVQKLDERPENESYFDIGHYARTLNGRSEPFSGIFGDLFSEQFSKGINDGERIQAFLDEAPMDDTMWRNYEKKGSREEEHFEKWSTISKLIQTRDRRKVNRDMFFTELGSWDHHNDMKAGLRSELRALNSGLTNFVNDAVNGGFWEDVMIVISSDFGRTLTPNSNDGSDHGWGGHYMILGGDIKGGQILGEYPSDLTPSGPLVDDRGRIIPTTSWDSIWNGVLEWTGVTDPTELDYCLPNRLNTISPVEGGGEFPLLTAASFFKSSSAINVRRRKLKTQMP